MVCWLHLSLRKCWILPRGYWNKDVIFSNPSLPWISAHGFPGSLVRTAEPQGESLNDSASRTQFNCNALIPFWNFRSRSTSIYTIQVNSTVTHVGITYLFRLSGKSIIYEPKGKQEKHHHFNLRKKPLPNRSNGIKHTMNWFKVLFLPP